MIFTYYQRTLAKILSRFSSPDSFVLIFFRDRNRWLSYY